MKLRALWVRLAPYLNVPEGPRVRRAVAVWLMLGGLVYMFRLPTTTTVLLGIFPPFWVGLVMVAISQWLLVTSLHGRLTTVGRAGAIAGAIMAFWLAIDFYPVAMIAVATYGWMCAMLVAEAVSHHDFIPPC